MAGYDFPWEQAAMNGELMPEGLTGAEQCAYQAIAYLYARFRLKTIDRERGHAEKSMIRAEMQRRKDADAYDSRLTACHVKLIKDSELAKTACRKNPTPENALRLCDILDGLLRLPEEPGQNVQTFGNLNARTRAGPGCADA